METSQASNERDVEEEARYHQVGRRSRFVKALDARGTVVLTLVSLVLRCATVTKTG